VCQPVSVVVQGELERLHFRLREYLAFGKEVLLGIGEISEMF